MQELIGIVLDVSCKGHAMILSSLLSAFQGGKESTSLHNICTYKQLNVELAAAGVQH